MPRVSWMVAAVTCAATTLLVLGMQWVHADWGPANRIVHVGIAVALAAGALLCLKRSRRAA